MTTIRPTSGAGIPNTVSETRGPEVAVNQPPSREEAQEQTFVSFVRPGQEVKIRGNATALNEQWIQNRNKFGFN